MPLPRLTAFVLAVGLSAWVSAPASACGPDADCLLEDGHSYRVRLPPGHDPSTSTRALIFAHGYKGSSAGTMRNAKLRALADEMGVVLIALDAKLDDWSLENVPLASADPTVDEMAYIDAVMEDAVMRFGISPTDSIVSGFSAGGMMTWTVACDRGNAFAGYVPIAGVFWAPEPENCPAPPASLIHIHGTSDGIVPLEGRPIQQTHQGDVHKTIGMYSEHGGFGPAEQVARSGLACSERRNPDGLRLDLCLHGGGHSFSIEDLRAALVRLME